MFIGFINILNHFKQFCDINGDKIKRGIPNNYYRYNCCSLRKMFMFSIFSMYYRCYSFYRTMHNILMFII